MPGEPLARLAKCRVQVSLIVEDTNQIAKILRFNGNWEPPPGPEVSQWQYSTWSKVVSFCLPKRVDTRSRREILSHEALFHANAMAWETGQKALTTEPYEIMDSVFVSFERLMQFDFVKKFETNIEEIKDALKTCEHFNFHVLEEGIQIDNPPESDTYDEDADYSCDNVD